MGCRHNSSQGKVSSDKLTEDKPEEIITQEVSSGIFTDLCVQLSTAQMLTAAQMLSAAQSSLEDNQVQSECPKGQK